MTKRDQKETVFPLRVFLITFLVLALLTTGQMLILGQYVDYQNIARGYVVGVVIYWIVGAAGFTLLIGLQINRRLERPLMRFAEATEKVASGDFSVYVKPPHTADKMNYMDHMFLDFNRIDMVPIPTDEAVREVQNILLGIETNVTNWQRKQNANQNYSSVIPYDMEQQREETRELLDDLTARDQRMIVGMVTLIHTASTKEQLDMDTEALQSVARQHLCQLAVLKYQQKEGFQTVLPFGVTRLKNCYRTLTTETTAILMPFNVQEIAHPGGICLGTNAISKNLIIYNREMLLNPSAFWLGVPGSGKSMGAKLEMLAILLMTNDDILCCDPENEYGALAKALGGEIIRIAAGSKHHINALDMVEGYGDTKDPVIDKSQFVMSMFEQLVGADKLGPREKSILDRCVRNLYTRAAKTGTTPCLPDLHKALLAQKEPEAHSLALACELFTTGSLDTFAHPTNVDINNRFVVYDLYDLGKQLKTLGLLVVTDAMLNRVSRNFREGRRTHLYFDEFHVVFDHENSSNFFVSAWRQFRKRNAFVNGITQNVEYLLDSVAARTLMSNSEFVVMFNQAASDRAELAQLLQISNQQMSYVTNAQAGNGLARIGGSLVPFQNQIPEDTRLYKLLTTKPTDRAG